MSYANTLGRENFSALPLGRNAYVGALNIYREIFALVLKMLLIGYFPPKCLVAADEDEIMVWGVCEPDVFMELQKSWRWAQRSFSNAAASEIAKLRKRGEGPNLSSAR